jgi:hypothetical protein
VPPSPPARRAELARELAVNAATKPVNVVVPGAVAVAGLVLGTVWLLALAALVYVVLVVMTFFDTREADRVVARRRAQEVAPAARPRELAAPIAARLEAAEREDAALRRAIGESELTFDDLLPEVDALMTAMRSVAVRATRLHEYLAEQDRNAVVRRLRACEGDPSQRDLATALEAQIDTMDRMATRLSRFDTELQQAAATLATMRGQVVALGVDAGGLGEERLAEQARGITARLGATSDALAELAEEGDQRTRSGRRA